MSKNPLVFSRLFRFAMSLPYKPYISISNVKNPKSCFEFLCQKFFFRTPHKIRLFSGISNSYVKKSPRLGTLIADVMSIFRIQMSFNTSCFSTFISESYSPCFGTVFTLRNELQLSNLPSYFLHLYPKYRKLARVNFLHLSELQNPELLSPSFTCLLFHSA